MSSGSRPIPATAFPGTTWRFATSRPDSRKSRWSMPVKRCASIQKDRFAYSNLSEAYERLGRYDEAKTILDQASARDLTSPSDSGARYELAFIRGDEAGMQRALESGKGSSFEPIMLLIQGQFAMRFREDTEFEAKSLRRASAWQKRAALRSSRGDSAARRSLPGGGGQSGPRPSDRLAVACSLR